MTLVKVCGLTEIEHVQTAVQAGVNFIGFVFAPSKRQVTVQQAQQLAAHIPPHVKKVGVFVNSDAETIHETFNDVPLDYVQYHGDETNDFIQQIGLPSIKAFSISNEEDVVKAADYDVNYYLFDTPGTTHRGGSGTTFNWALLEHCPIPAHKVFLAGGLTADNVQQAITALSPAGVDVSSGVEIDGRKDKQLIIQFVKTAKGAIG